MLRLALSLLTGGVSAGCALAAVGLALYAQGPSALAAAQLFGAVGFVAGLVCGALHLAVHGHTASATGASLPTAASVRAAPADADRALPPVRAVVARRSFSSSAFGA